MRVCHNVKLEYSFEVWLVEAGEYGPAVKYQLRVDELLMCTLVHV